MSTPAWKGSTMVGHTKRSQNRPISARLRLVEPNLASVASVRAEIAVRISLVDVLVSHEERCNREVPRHHAGLCEYAAKYFLRCLKHSFNGDLICARCQQTHRPP